MMRTRPCTSATAPATQSDTISSMSITEQIKEAPEHDRGRDTTLFSSHRQVWTPGKPTQHTIVVDAPSQKEVELNLDEISNAHSGVSDTLSLDNDVQYSEGNTPPDVTASCQECKGILYMDSSIPRDYPTDCSYVNKNDTEQERASPVVMNVLRFHRNNNDHGHLLLEYFARTRTKRPIIEQMNSLCSKQQSLLTLLFTEKRVHFNDSQMKDLVCYGRISDENCVTWKSITVTTRLQSQISSRTGKSQQLIISRVLRGQVAMATCSFGLQDRFDNDQQLQAALIVGQLR
ncbi:hypothetical protein Y032_0003g1632 [Ancylostoma ceylanicum]|uniref:Uncharacterized protein n=1 Tax=Ancylostoma ceylanicum TaxID=53326 RepID=A0A016VZV8_9BILA|nr:hypothetical protein Y032_0003g1632 [Ancylostoma ceylanicum]